MCSKRSSLKNFQDKLDSLKEEGRYRSLSLACGVDLTSNDYLGLAGHRLLRDAGIEYLQGGGDIGAGGSRLLRGHTGEHAALEEYAAAFFLAPKSLYLSSGFQANSTLFQTLCGRHDVIIFDEFVHASAREGIQNAHAKHIKVAHNDLSQFEDACEKACGMIGGSSGGRIWISVESVYSMDGDIAPLDALYNLAERYDAMLVVDEAHGTGVMGESGKGVSEGLIARYGYERLIVLHTCGKAMGVAGGLLCGAAEVIDTMVNAARGFIYSTAPIPMQAYLVRKALEIIASEEGEAQRQKLLVLSVKAQKLFGGSGTHIVPIVIGESERAVHIANLLQQKGWDIRAIRPPTVPEGAARLRLSLSADLGEDVLAAFADDVNACV